MRTKIGNLIHQNKLFVIIEILAVALFPLFLELVKLPRSIIPLFLLGWLSLWLRHKNWKEMGLCRPASWSGVIFMGSGIAIIGVYLSERAISPILFRLTGEKQAQVNVLASHQGNLFYFLLLLIGIWLLAAIGEELVYRGYVLNRLADLFGQSGVGWGIGLVVSSLMFSFGHGIRNWAYFIGDFLIGLIEGGMYLAHRRNLWLSIIFHGSWDTIYLVLFFLGLSWR